MKKISILIFSLALSLAINAQDIHFSQFYMAPLNLNPALTGVMNCQQRLAGNYRNRVIRACHNTNANIGDAGCL